MSVQRVDWFRRDPGGGTIYTRPEPARSWRDSLRPSDYEGAEWFFRDTSPDETADDLAEVLDNAVAAAGESGRNNIRRGFASRSPEQAPGDHA